MALVPFGYKPRISRIWLVKVSLSQIHHALLGRTSSRQILVEVTVGIRRGVAKLSARDSRRCLHPNNKLAAIMKEEWERD